MSAALHPALRAALRGDDPAALLAPAVAAVDWAAAVAQAETEGLGPLLRRWLGRAGQEAVRPAAVRERLERHCAAVAARNMLLAEELAALLPRFEARGLWVAPLRGLALAEMLHGDAIGSRPASDLDLLVRKAELPQVAALLAEAGFRDVDRRPGFAQRFSYTLEFARDRHGWLIVEPHWSLAYPPYVEALDTERVRGRCIRGRVAGVPAWRLPAEETLVNLCLHLVHKGAEAPLLWCQDIDRLLRQRPGFDWGVVLGLAAEARVGPLLGRALGRVTALLDTPLPAGVLPALAGAGQARIARLLGDAGGVEGRESVAMLLRLPGLRPRLRYAAGLLFPSAEFMMLQYGLTRRRQLGGAYLRRAGHFVWEGLRGTARLLS